jgi:hypothetical protein
MEFAWPIFGLILLAAAIGIFISSAFLLWGAKIAGVEGRTFGRAFGTTLLAGIASPVLSALFSVVPVIGGVLGVIGGFLIAAVIMMGIFQTSFGKALGATVLAWTLSLVVVGGLAIIVFLFLGGLAVL